MRNPIKLIMSCNDSALGKFANDTTDQLVCLNVTTVASARKPFSKLEWINSWIGYLHQSPKINFINNGLMYNVKW